MPTKEPKITVIVDEKLANKLNEVYHEARFKSLSKTERYLIDIGLNEVMEEISTPEGLEALRNKLANAHKNNIEDREAQ